MPWRPTCPSVPVSQSSLSPQAHLTRVSTLSGPGMCPYPASYAGRPAKELVSSPRFPVAFRPPAFASRVILSPLGDWPSLRSAHRFLLPEPDPVGIPRSTRSSCDRVGCPLDPGDGGAHTADSLSSAAACRITTATSLYLGQLSIIRSSTSRGITEGSLHSPVRSSPCLWLPDGTGTLGLLPGASHPAVTGEARPGGDRP